MTDKLLDTENEAMSKIVELEKQLMQKNKELDSVRVRATRHSLKPTELGLIYNLKKKRTANSGLSIFYIRTTGNYPVG